MPGSPIPRPPRDRTTAARTGLDTLRVLLVEDSRLDATLAQSDLAPGPFGAFAVVESRSLAMALEAVKEGGFDAAVLDLGLPDGEGMDAYHRLAQAAPALPVVVLTAADDTAQAVGALRAGAEDYLVKGDAVVGMLARTVRHAVERRRAKEKAAAAESQVALLFAHAPMPMEAYDLQGNLLRLNEAAHRTFGITERRPRYNLFDSPFVMPPMKESLVKGEPFATEIVFEPGRSSFPTTREEPVWTDARVFPTFDARGAVAGYFAVYEDITERKRTEEALRESEVMHRQLLTSVRDPVLAVDRAMKVLYCNEACATNLGMSAERLEGASLLDALPSFFDSPSHLAMQQVLDTGEPTETEDERSGVVLRLRVYPTPWGVLNIADDVTQRRRTERELKRLSAHLQSVQEETGRRIGREIHDELGASLTGLMMDLSLLKEGLGEDGLRRAERMQGTLDRLVETVRGIAADLRPPVLDSLGLTAAIEWLGRRFAARCGEPPTLSLHSGLDSLESARATAVFRIVQESLTNALRHAPKARVIVRTADLGGTMAVEVEDDGPGFDPNSDTEGLGLAGLRERAAFLGGNLEVEAGPGRGSVIRVLFPISP